MKKRLIIYIVSVIVILLLGIVTLTILTSKSNFDYETAKTKAEKYLNKNESSVPHI